MNRFNKVIGIALDFFFPRNKLEKEIGSINVEVLSEKLSRNKNVENKHTYTLFDYNDTLIKNMIWSLKYKKSHEVADIFAILLHDFLIEELSELNIYSDFNKPILIPIPMHKKHIRERGYNQTELLGKKLSHIGGEVFCTFDTKSLKKIKNTPSQTKLHRNKRLENVIGVFSVKDKNAIKKCSIILLDDVVTTGATFKEARKALLEAGAKNVICVALAH